MKNLFTLLTLLVILFAFISCSSSPSNSYNSELSSSSSNNFKPLTEEELKEKLRREECLNAASYIDGKLRFEPKYKNLLSMKVNGLKIVCDLKSTATLAIIKDIKIEVSLISKTGAQISTKRFDIYEFIRPHGSTKYKTEFGISNRDYKDLKKLEWRVLDASCH